MERNYLQKMFEETLSEVEKEAMTVASVICMEGLDIEVMYNLYMPDCPHLLYDIVDSLCARNLLFFANTNVFVVKRRFLTLY